MKSKPKPAAFPTASMDFQNASGPIDFQMTNDYMFHAVLQKNPKVLKSLICSLLHLLPTDIRSIEILNPITLGKTIHDKYFILDIHILLNNNTIINLEMQVASLLNWADRSLSYLCRSFDQLLSGNDYSSAYPAIHIGFLDFTPFPEYPEFYASYKLLNEKNHHVYSDKFTLRMVDLTQIHLATPQDQAYRLDRWAKLFKATTWEEIKMIAEHDNELLEASETLFTLNADWIVRKQCEACADYYRLHNSINQRMEELLTEKQGLLLENESLSSENQNLRNENAEKDMLIAQLKAQLHKHGI